jgi:anti-anti-sigma factor
MEITLNFEKAKAVLKASGMITTDYAHLLIEKLDEVLESNVKLLEIDFSACRIICSTGIGKLVAFANVFKENGGKVVIVKCSQNIYDLFTTIKIDEVLTFNL